MKITITSPKPVVCVTIQDIVNKLNRIALGVTLFSLDEKAPAQIFFGGNSNVDIHTKLILVMGLWLNEHYSQYGSYVSFGNHQENCIGEFYINDMPLDYLMAFLDSISDLNGVKIDLE